MTALGHFRQSIGVPPTDGLPSIAESRCPAPIIGSWTPTSGPTRAVAATDGSCQFRTNYPDDRRARSLSNAPSFTTLLSKDHLLVVQKGSRQQKLTMFWLNTQRAGITRLTEAEKGKLTLLNKGSCAGYTRVFPKEAALPDGSKIIFDTHTPTSQDGSGVIRIESGAAAKIIDLKSIEPDCVQVNSNFSRLLIKTRGRVDIYDFKVVIKNASLDGAKMGYLMESNLSTAAFSSATPITS
jgi:hypothetical protein